jgi:hypothetical protein
MFTRNFKQTGCQMVLDGLFTTATERPVARAAFAPEDVLLPHHCLFATEALGVPRPAVVEQCAQHGNWKRIRQFNASESTSPQRM